MTTILITGAASGIGREITQQLVAERMNLVLVARSVNRLEEAAEHIGQVADVGTEVLPADLPQAEDALRVCKYPTDDERPMSLLINNTGFGLDQGFVGGDIEREFNALNIVMRAVLMTYHVVVPGIATRGGGDVLNIASTAALTAQEAYLVYRVWVCTLTEGLAVSLEGTGANVTVVCPGLVHTEFHRKVNADPEQWPESVFTPAGRVAAEAIGGARRGETAVMPPWRYRALAGAFKVAPRSLVCTVAGPERSGRRG